MSDPVWLEMITALAGEDQDLAEGHFVTDLGQVPLFESTDAMPQWPFCVLYDGRPNQTVVVVADSPESAAQTMQALVVKVNRQAARLGYPPLFTPVAGACLT